MWRQKTSCIVFSVSLLGDLVWTVRLIHVQSSQRLWGFVYRRYVMKERVLRTNSTPNSARLRFKNAPARKNNTLKNTYIGKIQRKVWPRKVVRKVELSARRRLWEDRKVPPPPSRRLSQPSREPRRRAPLWAGIFSGLLIWVYERVRASRQEAASGLTQSAALLWGGTCFPRDGGVS